MKNQIIHSCRIIILIICPLYCYGQICNNPDTTINDKLMLYVYERENEKSVETFADISTDSVLYMSEEEPIFKLEYYTELGSAYSLFINADSTEALIAVYFNDNQFYVLTVFPITPINSYLLKHHRCIHTKYPHFQTESGIQIGMSIDDLIKLKGQNYSINKHNDIQYTYLSPLALRDKEIYDWCIKNNKGDFQLVVAIAQDKIINFMLIEKHIGWFDE